MHNGTLQTSLTDILHAWKTHYAALAADPTGNSQDRTKWDKLFPPTQDKEELFGISDTIERDEMR